MSRNRLAVHSSILFIWLLFMPIFAHSAGDDTSGVEQVKESVEIPGAIVNSADDTTTGPGFLSRWLHMLDSDIDGASKESSVLAYTTQVPGDLAKALNIAGGEKGASGVMWLLLKSVMSIVIGLLVVFLLKKTLQTRLAPLTQLVPPEGEGLSKLAAGTLRSLPELVSLIVLALSSSLFFLLIAGGISSEGRMVYQLILGIVLVFLSFKIISNIIFSPGDKSIRFFSINESLVRPLHLAFVLSLTLLASALLFMRCFNELGAQPQTLSWLAIILGSMIIAIIAYIILYLRKPVMAFLQVESEHEESSWLKQNFAQYWHFPVLLYVAVIWFIWIGQEATGTAVRNGSFVISVLIAPIYLGLSHMGKVLIGSVVESLGIGQQEEADETPSLEEQNSSAVEIAAKAHSFFRIILIVVLSIWILSLWGYNFPYASYAMKAIFESLVVIGLALFCWRYASEFIEKKMADSTPEIENKEEGGDNEFGGAVSRERSHTLLPMLRKAIATILIVMVALIIVSSLGVNIGPLLAGAGVLGLAVGFGAQKLVTDVLSGFFFLLDDAFRVGEYIQAGKIRGTVEAITLRNVLLRHHLGMLQVVPHSDLGAVTNYNRGGIVIKFPLEFSYDADIDKVRKIIKKVGQEMLADEELGDGFLLPMKSQGVYSITNSVMVIRVKFTAKPGQQFVIKREAFRRLTEAFNAKGIYYAHRKVIVDFPADVQQSNVSEQTQEKALQAGAAAAITPPVVQQIESNE